MFKRPILEVKLIFFSQIIPRLYYRKNFRNWWIHRNNCDFVKGVFLYPIKIGCQTVFKQNKRQFYMHIMEGYETNEIQPGYRCTSSSKYNNIESTPNIAIISLYQKLFSNTKTRFSRPLILGWNDENLLEMS
ncbi:hypothetical protein Glove_624g3 [Diversispora epigaea]|uniref:Uncharacterized protein n=1 Tax=Diversispora epigaea TaxID=1348612 RepID=A0A397GBM2_9GLOM|nr:hypothetical protein Glove_624g3 [Diversispora epigaea]